MGLRDWAIDSTDAGANAMLDRARVLGLRGRAWSIAELRLTEPDYERACRWLAALEPRKARELRESTALGLMLLVVASETARRRARSGGVWPVFTQLRMRRETADVLLDANGTPTLTVRQAVGKAAFRCGLRVALNSGQPWYSTVVLQYGLSLPGLTEMLPRWAAQGLPDSVMPLFDGPEHSDEFRKTWSALRSLADPTSLDEARAVLESSPWVLGAWVERLLELGTALAPSTTTLDDTVTRIEPVEPVLRACVLWSEARPRLSLELAPALCEPSLTDDRYRVIVDGKPCARYVRHERSGAHRPTRERLDVDCPAQSLRVVLVDRTGEVALEQDVEVWAEDSLACTYAQSGHLLSANESVPARGVLVFEAGAVVTPGRPRGAVQRFGDRQALELDGTSVRLEWPDGSTWSGTRGERRAAVLRGEPLDPSVELNGLARVGSPEPLLKVSAPGWRLEGPRQLVGPVSPSSSPRLSLAVQRANRDRARMECTLPLEGATFRRDGTWQVPGTRVEMREIRTLAWRILSPAPPRGSAVVLAGAHVVDRITELARASRLSGHALGLGEPLAWVDSAHLYAADVEPRPLVSEVVDHGLLDDCIVDGTFSQLRFSDTLEPEGARVVAWTPDGVVSVQDIAAEDDTWLVDLGARPIALVVGFGTARLAAWWREGWAGALAQVSETDAEEIARFVRIARLPILEAGSREPVRAFARSHVRACARAWWMDTHELEDGSASGLLNDLWKGAASVAGQWLSAQRELYADGTHAFDPPRSEEVLGILGQREDGGCYVSTGFRRAAELGAPWCDPYLRGQREFIERERTKHGRDWLARTRKELEQDEDKLEQPSGRAAFQSLARVLGISEERCRELLDERGGPVSLAKRVALAHRDFAYLSTWRALRHEP